MTWVKGTTTWGQLEHKLAQLACGEVADDSGTTVASASRWLREVTRTVTDLATTSTSTTVTSASASFTAADIGALVLGSGLPLGASVVSVTNATTVVLSQAATATASGVTATIATNTIRTPASQDIASGDGANRTGYFLNVGNSTATAATTMTAGLAGTNHACRVSSPFTSTPTGMTNARWLVRINVATPNSVAGNYSTAQISWQVSDPDSIAVVGPSTVNLNAAGLGTITNGLTVTLTDPSGTLTAGVYFYRAFKTGYLYGIDSWPMLHQASGAPSFTTAPPGVSGTDWDVLTDAVGQGQTSSTFFGRWGLLFHGLGIKTATGNSGALYTVNWPMALIKLRMFLAAATSAALSLDLGQSKRDTVQTPGTFRNIGGYRLTSWLNVFTATSQTAATAVQYWASITADGIVLAVNADTAASGKLATAYVCKFAAAEPTYDPFPVQFNPYHHDQSVDNQTNIGMDTAAVSYWSTRHRLDGAEQSASRDWQTRWMRGEHLMLTYTSGGSGTDAAVNGWSATSPSNGMPLELKAVGEASAQGGTYEPWNALHLAKPGPDGKWLLHGHTYSEGDLSAITTSTIRALRGTQSTRFCYLSGDGWGSGDELTDTATGQKWFLLAPDYPGHGTARVRQTASSYTGGVAVAEL